MSSAGQGKAVGEGLSRPRGPRPGGPNQKNSGQSDLNVIKIHHRGGVRTWLSDQVRKRLGAFGLIVPSIAQCAVGAALAWIVAVHLLGHTHPLFAPISVMICVGVGLGQRLRRVVELVVG
ncbi:FUSC family protein, partial [Streptosporangium amethystogenes]|uniref:FUSC family protein n=1 Tax=Streptosporangium amethystogenes TaxID=2002 RepID=UPI0037B31BC5